MTAKRAYIVGCASAGRTAADDVSGGFRSAAAAETHRAWETTAIASATDSLFRTGKILDCVPSVCQPEGRYLPEAACRDEPTPPGECGMSSAPHLPVPTTTPKGPRLRRRDRALETNVREKIGTISPRTRSAGNVADLDFLIFTLGRDWVRILPSGGQSCCSCILPV